MLSQKVRSPFSRPSRIPSYKCTTAFFKSTHLLMGTWALENRLTAIVGEGRGGLGEKGEGIKQKEKQEKVKNSKTDNSMVSTRGKGRWGEAEEGKGGANSDGGRLDLG